MTWLALAIFTFLATHVIPGIKPLRLFCTQLFGERVYLCLYSAASLATISWVIWAYAQAPYHEVWPYSAGTLWVPVLVMPVACFLIVAGISSPNPFSLGWGSKTFDAARPGIVGLFKHPVLWGLTLWAASHIIANGDAASLLVFGCMGLLSIAGPALLDRKRKATLGEPQWQQLTEQVDAVPLARKILQIGLFRLIASLAVYAGLIFAHGPVIGVSPLAGLNL